MEIRCPSCSAAYTFDVSRIPPEGLNVRCNACRDVFRVRAQVRPAYWIQNHPAADPRPFENLEAIARALRSGDVPASATVSRDGERFAPLASLADALATASSNRMTPVPAPSSSPPSDASRPASTPPTRPRPTARTAPLGTVDATSPSGAHAPIRITGDLHAIPDRDEVPTRDVNATVVLRDEAEDHLRQLRAVGPAPMPGAVATPAPVAGTVRHGAPSPMRGATAPPPQPLQTSAPALDASPGISETTPLTPALLAAAAAAAGRSGPPPQPLQSGEGPSARPTVGQELAVRPGTAPPAPAAPVSAAPSASRAAPVRSQRIERRRDAEAYSLGEPARRESDRWTLDGGATEDDPLDAILAQQARRSNGLLRFFLVIILVGIGVFVGIAIAAPERLGIEGLVPWASSPPPTSDGEAGENEGAAVEGEEEDGAAPDDDGTPGDDAAPAEGSGEAGPAAARDARPDTAGAAEAQPEGLRERPEAPTTAAVGADATPRDEGRSRGSRGRDSVTELVARGERALREGRLDEAMTAFSSAADRGDHVEAHTGVADTYAAMGRHDLALARYERATRMGPRYQPAWVGLARMNERAGSPERAIAAWREVLQIRDAGRHADTARAALARLGAR